MLDVHNLSKAFGGLQVTRNVSFKLEQGERRVILGPNGAGKTTLFNLLVGELKPTAGDILVGGTSISGMSVSQRSRMGLSRSYQKNNLFEDLTVRENLTLAAAAAQGKIAWLVKDSFRDRGVKEAVEEAAELVSLTDSPVIRLNRAVAVGQADGPSAGLAALAEVDPHVPRYLAAAAYLHEQRGDLATAAKLYVEAAAGASNLAERDHLTRSAARLRQSLPGEPPGAATFEAQP